MSPVDIDAMLKLTRKEQEHAAKRVLKLYELEAALKDPEQKRGSSLGRSLSTYWRHRVTR